MKINSIQNGQKLSNKTAKAGALAGLAGCAAYLLKNKDDIFINNIENATNHKLDNLKNKFGFVVEEKLDKAKSLKLLDGRSKAVIFGIPAAFVVGAVIASAILGKTAGVVAEKIQQKKENNKEVELKKENIIEKQSKGENMPVFVCDPDFDIAHLSFSDLENNAEKEKAYRVLCGNNAEVAD